MKSILQRMTLLVALLFLSQSAWAQFKVSGKISDEAGEALVGVSVVVKGTTNGTITDIDGNYSLQVSSGSSATFTEGGIQRTESDSKYRQVAQRPSY